MKKMDEDDSIWHEFLLISYLLGFVQEVNAAGPGLHVEQDQSVYVPEQMVFHDGGIGKTHSQRMHSLMKTPSHQQKRMPPEQACYRTGIAGLEELPFVLQDEPVHFRVGREYGRFPEYVGGENGAEFGHPIIYKGFGIFGLVSGDELEGFSHQGQPEVPRWKSPPAASGGAEEEEENERDEKREDSI